MLSKITSWRHSKIIAFALAVAVFLTAFYGLVPVISLAEATEAPATQAEAVVGYWDGTTTDVATAFAGQAGKGGSAESPYEITNGTQLYAAVNSTDVLYFKLMNDIVLQENDADADRVAGFKAASTYDTSGLHNWNVDNPSKGFIGHIDGNFKTVRGLLVESATTTTNWASGHGFIARVGGSASISNLTIDGAFVNSKYFTGGLIGAVSSSSSDTITIERFVLKNSKIKNTYGSVTNDAQASLGGIIGFTSSKTIVNINNCSVYNNAFEDGLTANKYRGSMVGNMWYDGYVNVSNSVFLDCYPYTKSSAGAAYTNVYTDAEPQNSSGSTTKADGLRGGTAYDITGLTPAHGWVVEDANSAPVYVGAENVSKYDYETPIWNETTAALSSLATDGDVKLISTGAELHAAVTCTENLSFKLINDIVLQDADELAEVEKLIAGTSTGEITPNNWAYGSGDFIGHIDGNFHTVTGLYVNATSRTGGFIESAKGGALVENLIFDKSYITSNKYQIGGIVGFTGAKGTSGTVTVSGCTIKNSKIHNTNTTSTAANNAAGGIFSGEYWCPGVIENTVIYNTDVISDKGEDRAFTGGDYWVSCTVTNSIFVAKGSVVLNSSSYLKNCANSYVTFASSVTGITQKAEADLMGGIAYDNTNLTPAHGWIVEDAESYPVYVGAENVSKYDYETPVWNQGKAELSSLAGGSGASEAEAKLIYTGAELRAAVTCTENLYFKLMNDIVLQDADKLAEVEALISGNPTGTATPNNWAYGSGNFIGHIDGNFHTITGLYVDATSRAGAFIESPTASASVKNLIFDKSYITSSKHQIGGIFGLNGNNTAGTISVSGCTIKNSKLHNTNTTSTVANNAVGGIFSGAYFVAGAIENTVIYNTEIISDSGKAFGFLGGDYWKKCPVKNSVLITGDNVVLNESYLENCSNTYTNVANKESGITVLSEDQLKGVALPGITPATGWVIAENQYPEYKAEPVPESYISTTWNGLKYSSGVDLNTVLAGEGTLDEPYKIYHGFELHAALRNTEAGKYFSIENDIYLNKEGSWVNEWGTWKSSTKFSGTLNGNGHTVYGFYESSNGDGNDTWTASAGVGFISNIGTATIKDLHIRNVNLIEYGQHDGNGILVGIADDVTITGCSINGGTLKNGTSIAAGFVGKVNNSANIENSVLAGGTIKHNESNELTVGGFVGNIADGATVTLNKVVSNGYAAVASGDANETNAYAIVDKTVAQFKAELSDDDKNALAEYFYWDNLSDNAPMLKNRVATFGKDIDGNEGTELDYDDMLALKNIVLYGNTAQANASTSKGYNDLEGIDITDIVCLKKNCN